MKATCSCGCEFEYAESDIQPGHRVMCGDSTRAEDVERLMDGEKADLCFTSPPYGQKRDYTKESNGSDWDKLMRGVFANLPMSDAGQVLVNLGLIHRDGECILYWEGWVSSMKADGWRLFGWYVWDQCSGLPGDWNGRLGPSHEFVFHFNKQSVKPNKWVAKKEESIKLKTGGGLRKKDGTPRGVDSPEAGLQPHKIPDSVIRISRNATIDMARENHPATFPIQFPAFVIQSWPGLVYDPFLGSGTTLIAAENLNRRCYGMEISPRYVEVIVVRYLRHVGPGKYPELEARYSELLNR